VRIDDVVDAYRRELAVRRGLSARTVAAYAAEARSLLAFLADLAGQDASEPISEQDVRVIQQAVDAGRALVLVNNKWDLVDEERQKMLLWEVEHDLAHVSWAPHINLAARTGWMPHPA